MRGGGGRVLSAGPRATIGRVAAAHSQGEQGLKETLPAKAESVLPRYRRWKLEVVVVIRGASREGARWLRPLGWVEPRLWRA